MTTSDSTDEIDRYIWWRRPKPYTRIEILCDVAVHCLGIVVAILAGGTLLIVAALRTAPEQTPAIAIYVGSLVALFVASLAFNIAPIAPIKRFLARLDQAAIFLLIAGTYTPVLAMLSGTPTGPLMLTMGRLCHRHRTEAIRTSAFRPACPDPIGWHRLEWDRRLQFARTGSASKHALAIACRRGRLLLWNHLPRVGEAELSQGTLALLCSFRSQSASFAHPRLYGPTQIVTALRQRASGHPSICSVALLGLYRPEKSFASLAST